MAKTDEDFTKELVTRISEAMKDGLKEGLGSGLQLAEMARNEAAKLLAEKKRGFVPMAACMKCRQPINVCGGPEMKKLLDKDGKEVLGPDGKVQMVQATGDREADANHELIVVNVGDREANKFLTCVIINSVKYRSGRAGHRILVPKNNDIAAILSNFEKTEIDQRQGKETQYNSGMLGRGTGRTGIRPPKMQLSKRSYV